METFRGGRSEGKMVKGRVEPAPHRNAEEELFREGGDSEGSAAILLCGNVLVKLASNKA